MSQMERFGATAYNVDDERRNSAEKFRVDVRGVGESTWASNALRFDTEEAASVYARDLYGRWMGMDGFRVVRADTPERETVDPEEVRTY